MATRQTSFLFLVFTFERFPFKQSQLGGYSLMYGDVQSDDVWQYNNKLWNKFDSLEKPRSSHYTALIGNDIFHIGGRYFVENQQFSNQQFYRFE